MRSGGCDSSRRFECFYLSPLTGQLQWLRHVAAAEGVWLYSSTLHWPAQVPGVGSTQSNSAQGRISKLYKLLFLRIDETWILLAKKINSIQGISTPKSANLDCLLNTLEIFQAFRILQLQTPTQVPLIFAGWTRRPTWWPSSRALKPQVSSSFKQFNEFIWIQCRHLKDSKRQLWFGLFLIFSVEARGVKVVYLIFGIFCLDDFRLRVASGFAIWTASTCRTEMFWTLSMRQKTLGYTSVGP